MGCCSSTVTAVRPLVDGDQDETGSKLGSRGDSAVSKGTTDSGVVMENKEMPVLPGAVPRILPPLTLGCGGASVADRIAQDGVHERQKSSEILEELLNQGIISEGKSRERSNMAGEAYNIILDDKDLVRRRPPSRLESLKAKKMQSVPSREEIDEKIRLAEERRKSREDELKARLRTKSARVRVRVPVSNATKDEDTSGTPVEAFQSPVTSDPPPQFHNQGACSLAEGKECVSEAGHDSSECGEETGRKENRKGGEKEGESGDNREEGAESVSAGGEEEELKQVTELQEMKLLTE
ncbi:stathmin domain-containing protein 1 [Solea senegalensis]|uniref:Stathmin domain-containing protein 1 n=1 Tax=Solea senegalensis TaxID=28829 RepID=A0AAV6R8H2_SOLSE|nr:stathmin domain-containing protein 1 [Solea senegalensis]KAG7501310.1 stathmin domain-containing protein 1 [Solea senegalensis]